MCLALHAALSGNIIIIIGVREPHLLYRSSFQSLLLIGQIWFKLSRDREGLGLGEGLSIGGFENSCGIDLSSE